MDAKKALEMLRNQALERQTKLFDLAEQESDSVMKYELFAKGRTYYEFISTINVMLKNL